MTSKSLNRLKDNREEIQSILYDIDGKYHHLSQYLEELTENEFEKECYHFEDLFNEILDYEN